MLTSGEGRGSKVAAWLHHHKWHRPVVVFVTAVLAYHLGVLLSSVGPSTSPSNRSTPGVRLESTPHDVSDDAAVPPQQAIPGPTGAPSWAEESGVRLFIGIMSKPWGYAGDGPEKRKAIRETWLPRAKAQPGVEARFVVGRAGEDIVQESFLKQVDNHPDEFLLVPMEECSTCGARKIIEMFQAAMEEFSPQWFLKVEDSVYVSPSHALAALPQWRAMGVEYVGCLAHNRHVNWHTLDGKQVVQSADRDMIGWQYPAHSRRTAYAVSAEAVNAVILPNTDTLRELWDEETSVAVWMLAFKVNFWDDMRLCTPVCSVAAIAVANNACGGLCVPVDDMHYVERDARCHEQPPAELPYLNSFRQNEAFHSMRVL
eukprot:jgi/Ulvmu1/11934/UM082_0013.1